jgi:hypothetical protein
LNHFPYWRQPATHNVNLEQKKIENIDSQKQNNYTIEYENRKWNILSAGNNQEDIKFTKNVSEFFD